MERALTPQEKKNYLLAKYTKRDYKVEDLKPKFAVYFNPSIEKIKDWTLVCVCSTLEESKREILWRKKYMETGDGDLVVDNCEEFKTWRDETKNIDPNTGQSYEPGQELMKLDYNIPGGMLQVIANSTPEQQNKNGFKGISHYLGIEIGNYQGMYKIEEFYEI
jgi:hypothetical protein